MQQWGDAFSGVLVPTLHPIPHFHWKRGVTRQEGPNFSPHGRRIMRLFFFYFLLTRSLCPHRMLMVGWGLSITQTDTTRTLESVPLVLSTTFTHNNKLPQSHCYPPQRAPHPLTAHALSPPPMDSPLSPLSVEFVSHHH